MATRDKDNNVVKSIDGITDFSGGMDWINEGSKLSANSCRLLQNVDIRDGNARKTKGQKSLAKIEIGAAYYDRFNAAGLSSSKWLGVEGTGAIIINNDNELSITGGTAAWDSTGVISLRATPLAALSYIEFTLITPSAMVSSSRLRVGLSADNTALDTDSGLEIEFDESGDIIRREASAETDTGVNWAVDTKYRIRFEKQESGWSVHIVDITNAPNTAVQLFATTFEGTTTSYLELQAYGSEWLFEDVLYHEGFGTAGERVAATGVVKFYRETGSGSDELIVFAHGIMYKFDFDNGYTVLKSGLNTASRMKYRVFNDQLICVNGVDNNFVYTGTAVIGLGSGASISPVADSIEVHLQSVFLLKGNELYRNTPGNLLQWDALSPIVELDAWRGDEGVGMVKLGTNLYIIKENSVWELTGTTDANFRLRRILGARGCIAPDSIATNGTVVFWRGSDGVYRFDGVRTVLISYKIHQAFNQTLASEFPSTVAGQAQDSVGIIHNYKYRLAVSQNGEADTTINNFEYVFDLLAGGGNGGWTQRTSRNVNAYAVLDGAGDSNELLYVHSDATNDLMVGEIDDGILYNGYTNVTTIDMADTDFIGRVASRRNVGKGGGNDFLNKSWNGHKVYFEPKGDHYLGLKVHTKYNTQGSLLVFQEHSTMSTNTLNGTDIALDGTQVMIDGFVEENTKLLQYPASSNKTRGTEMWWEITQAQEVRTLANTTPSGLLSNPGNFEPFCIKRVVIQFTEDNY